jgi:enoyl-CoA hydratase
MPSPYDSYVGLKFARPMPRVLEVIFDRPGKLNALTEDMHRELAEVWRDIDGDPDVSCVLLRGANDTYSAGGDLSLVQEMTESFDARAKIWKETRDLVYGVINCAKPIVSAINGPAVGAGLAAGLLADISIVSKSARIIDGHTKLGVAAGDHAAIVWPLLCGMAKAKYYLLLCEPVGGEEAERIGLVSLCVDDDKLYDTALDVCRKLADGAPSAIRWTKYALNNWLRMAGPSFDASLALEILGMTGPDINEGVAAIREKRRPTFDPGSEV